MDNRRARLVPGLVCLGWAVLLALWTFGLLSQEAPKVASAFLPSNASFYVAKALHVSAYALLACLVCWLPVRWGIRAALLVGLVGHGALTEYLQQYVPGRTGKPADVGLDTAGVLLGLAVGLALRRLRDRAAPPLRPGPRA